MKDLNKKIGAGVLAVGLVIGGLGLSGGLVAHADSIDEDPFEGIELIDKDDFNEEDFDKLLKEWLEGVSVNVEKVEGGQLIVVSSQK